METQWSLVIFTLFVCLSCGTIGIASWLALKGKGEGTFMHATLASLASLAIGGIGSFTHLQHWERIFNGFGHITSGITQELIGVVVVGVLLVVWFFMIRNGKGISKALAGITLAASVLMVLATAHSYLMPARPAWGLMLIVFYLGNAFVLGAACMWVIGHVVKDEAVQAEGEKLTFVASIAALVANIAYVAGCAMVHFADFGHYADPTMMTTAPTHVESLMDIMISGSAAGMFWSSMACAVAVIALVFFAKKTPASAFPLASVTFLVALVGSVLFRVLIYMVGMPVVLLY